jgi:hypothetical protein
MTGVVPVSIVVKPAMLRMGNRGTHYPSMGAE